MRILTLGAGTVGTWIADLLCRHGHSVTVVDNDPEHTRRINNELDVRVVTGWILGSDVTIFPVITETPTASTAIAATANIGET